MNVISMVKEKIKINELDFCFEIAKSLFISIYPSYFKDDCYNTEFVEDISHAAFKEICKIMGVVMADVNPQDLLTQLTTLVFEEDIKPFYYLDCNKNNESYSVAQLFIINRIIEVCYSKLISYELFKLYVNESKVEFLSNEASVTEKANWSLKHFKRFLDFTSSMQDPYGEFPDKDVSCSDFLKEKYHSINFADSDLGSKDSPINSSVFWDNLIYSKVQNSDTLLDYYKYGATYNSLHSIQDIINLFDSDIVWAFFQDFQLPDKYKEKIWTAMIYDAIYYSYICASFFNCDEKHQISFKLMCQSFYKLHVMPIISEHTNKNSFFEIFFDVNANVDSAEKELAVEEYRKILYNYRNLCVSDRYSYISAFNDKIKKCPKNTRFSQPPEFYETILFWIMLHCNIQKSKFTDLNQFKKIYFESIGLDKMKQETTDTIFRFETGWYLLTVLFNCTINVDCIVDENCHSAPTKMLFTFQALNEASLELVEAIREQEYFDEMVYIISLIILKAQHCDPEKYREIISSFKSIVIKKQATQTYKLNLHLSTKESYHVKDKVYLNPDLKAKLNLRGKTIECIRTLFNVTGLQYTKKQIMYYCNRKKAIVEKELYKLIKLGEIREISYTDSREKYFEKIKSKHASTEQLNNLLHKKNHTAKES